MKKIKYIDKLQLVLKISERCNLACTYCYYFKGSNDTALSKPPLMSHNISNKIINDIKDILDGGTVIGTLEFILHGGEPLLFKLKSLKALIQKIVNEFDHRLNLEIGVQTNGTLISSEFIDMVNHFSIGVGVSIDGLKEAHDKCRIYPSGRGSFDDVKSGIQKLTKHIDVNSAPEIGVISVITDDVSVMDTYSYLVNELKIKRISFLLPDTNHDKDLDSKFVTDVGKSLYKCFELWMQNPSVHFKNVIDYIQAFQKKEYIPDRYSIDETNNLDEIIGLRLVVIRSDGELHYYDRFLPASSEAYLYNRPQNILDINILEYVTSEVFDTINDLYVGTPDECQRCEFVKVCNGGDLEHRFSKSNGFNNPSVYCEALKIFYSKINEKLHESGLSKEYIKEMLRA